MKILKLVILSILISTGISSFSSTVDDTQIRKTGSFHAVKVSTGIDLYLQLGNSEEVIVEANEDIIDDLITETDNGVLKIYMKKNLNWNWNKTRKVYVTAKDLDLIDASSGSDVESKGTLQCQTLKIDASSGSDIDLDLNVNELFVKISSGSDAELKGVANYLKASSSSGSDLDAVELKTKVCEVSASSGSDVNVFVTESIKADASSGGDIRYSGNPAQKEIDESSGGDVCKR